MDGIKNLKINTDMFNNSNSFKLNHNTIGTKIVIKVEDAVKEETVENKDNNDIRRKK